jgi:hypothetical protein
MHKFLAADVATAASRSSIWHCSGSQILVEGCNTAEAWKNVGTATLPGPPVEAVFVESKAIVAVTAQGRRMHKAASFSSFATFCILGQVVVVVSSQLGCTECCHASL